MRVKTVLPPHPVHHRLVGKWVLSCLPSSTTRAAMFITLITCRCLPLLLLQDISCQLPLPRRRSNHTTRMHPSPHSRLLPRPVHTFVNCFHVRTRLMSHFFLFTHNSFLSILLQLSCLPPRAAILSIRKYCRQRFPSILLLHSVDPLRQVPVTFFFLLTPHSKFSEPFFCLHHARG